MSLDKYKKLRLAPFKHGLPMPTAFIEGLSYLEMVQLLYDTLLDVIGNSNVLYEYMQNFISNYNMKMEEFMTEQLEKMVVDGTLRKLIEGMTGEISALRDELTQQINDLEAENETRLTNLETNYKTLIDDFKNDFQTRFDNFETEVNTDIDEINTRLDEELALANEGLNELAGQLGTLVSYETQLTDLLSKENLVIENPDTKYWAGQYDRTKYTLTIPTGTNDLQVDSRSITDNVYDQIYLSLKKAPIQSVKVQVTAKVLAGSGKVSFRFMNMGNPVPMTFTSSQDWETHTVTVPVPKSPTYFFALIMESNSSILFNKIKVYEDYVQPLSLMELTTRTENKDLVSMSDGMINEMVEVGRTYQLNINNLIYYNDFTQQDMENKTYQNKTPLDCSSFLLNVIEAIPYRGQRLFNSNKTRKLEWGLKHIPDKVRYTFQMAKWALDKGLLYEIDEDFTNVDNGDLIFMVGDNKTDQYLNVIHVSMVLAKPNYNTVSLMHYTSEANSNIFEIGQYHYWKKFKYGMKLPMPALSYVRGENLINEGVDGFTLNNTNRSVTLSSEKIENNNLYTLLINGYEGGSLTDTYMLLQLTGGGSDSEIIFSDHNSGIKENGNRVIRFFVKGRPSGTIFLNVALPASSTSGSVMAENVRLYKGYVTETLS